MTRAARGRTAWAAVLGLVAGLLAAALPAPRPSYAETRVRGFDLKIAAGVGAERTLSPTRTEAHAAPYDDLAVGYPLVSRGANGAERSANQLKLQKQLASEQQMSQLASEGGQSIAGAGGRVAIRDIDRLLGQYGGSARVWAKIRSSNFKAADGTSFEIHAYRNVQTGEVVEMKTKIQ